MAVISLKLTEALDAMLTSQAQRRRLSKSELVRRALTAFLQASEQGCLLPINPVHTCNHRPISRRWAGFSSVSLG